MEVLDFFRKLFDTSDWPPRWHCGNWTQFHGWLYIVSDLLIWSAYFAIPLTIIKYISKRADAQFVRAYFLFAGFILACGSTHLLDAITFWFPAYRLNALVRFITGVLSWITVFYIIKILPAANSLRSYAELEKEIAERTKVEEELKVANQQLTEVQELVQLGHWQWDVVNNKRSWSAELYKIYEEHPGKKLEGLSLEEIHPDDREFVSNLIQKALTEKVFPTFTYRIVLSNGKEKIIQTKGQVITDGQGQVVQIIGTAQDVTDMQKSQQQLMERTHELEATNAELTRFAYVASHDLQEPLRKIMTFGSLLEKELNGSVNDKARMYMEKIVQSSGRMQRLIDDILSFSSLRVTTATFEPTDLNQVLKQVLSDMEVSIETAGAVVHSDSLPTLDAIPSQMEQLFQNLLSNAIKFRKEGEAPVITISSAIETTDELRSHGLSEAIEAFGAEFHRGREHFAVIEVKDNGIGFDETYIEKIFEIFQRLHTHKTYEGTGIGLAISKKIVENHHGHIVAHGVPGEGAVFTLVLPLSQKHFSTNNKPVSKS